jgi:hypothetical protein
MSGHGHWGRLRKRWQKAGMFDQALKVAEGIEDAEKRAWALIAEEQGRNV